MRQFANILFAAFAATYPVREASAQDMVPVVQSLHDGATIAYVAQRCAAFGAAQKDYVEAHYTADTAPPIEAEFNKHFAGVLMFANPAELGTTQSTYQLLYDLAPLAKLYQSRFEMNRLATGHPWKHDELLLSDKNICKMMMTQ